MLRKGLQNALLVRLARPLNGGRMSKNKVNKIFQVLIRSCFVLHSRGGYGDGEEHDAFPCQHEPGEGSMNLFLIVVLVRCRCRVSLTLLSILTLTKTPLSWKKEPVATQIGCRYPKLE